MYKRILSLFLAALMAFPLLAATPTQENKTVVKDSSQPIAEQENTSNQVSSDPLTLPVNFGGGVPN